MPGSPGPQRRRNAVAVLGLLLLPLACCGLPVLIAAGALGGLGAALGSPWLIGTAAVLIVAGVTRLIRRRVVGRHNCRPPDGDGSTTPTNERSA
jgi:hypothetical protein